MARFSLRRYMEDTNQKEIPEDHWAHECDGRMILIDEDNLRFVEGTLYVSDEDWEEPDVKPCPFCGEVEKIVFSQEGPNYRGYCQTCGALTGAKKSLTEARDAWNTRC